MNSKIHSAWFEGKPFWKSVTKRRENAFSLVELLVSMAILTTLMVLLFAFFEQATKAWQTSEKKVDAFREARAALFYLKKDLEGILVDSSVPFFYFDNPGTIAPISYSGPALNTPAANGDALFFISSQSQDAQDSTKSKSDLCAVGYYLVYDKNAAAISGTKKSYRLLRYFKSSDDTWQSSSHGLLPFLQSVQSSTPDNSLLFPAALGTTSGDEVIARNVINFEAKPLDSDYQPLSGSGALVVKPAFFEISLTALNLETAQKLNSQNEWHDSSGKLFKENAQIFKLRVAIPQ